GHLHVASAARLVPRRLTSTPGRRTWSPPKRLRDEIDFTAEGETDMRYRELGRTGVRVSPLCLGAMNFGGDLTDDDEAVATISAALDRGINFIDTANVYNRGGWETVVGKALNGRRDDVVLATKVHGQMG